MNFRGIEEIRRDYNEKVLEEHKVTYQADDIEMLTKLLESNGYIYCYKTDNNEYVYRKNCYNQSTISRLYLKEGQ